MELYYTPTIEEFYVGFECERICYEADIDKLKELKLNNFDKTNLNKFWVKIDIASFINDTFHSFIGDINQYRVKYLDRSDIEFLGFINIEHQGMSENYGYLFNKPSKSFENNKIELRFWYDTNRIFINDSGVILFNGIVKNKSELKQVLKMLNIE